MVVSEGEKRISILKSSSNMRHLSSCAACQRPHGAHILDGQTPSNRQDSLLRRTACTLSSTSRQRKQRAWHGSRACSAVQCSAVL
eukprot:2197522-Rhodomonas_salina.6